MVKGSALKILVPWGNQVKLGLDVRKSKLYLDDALALRGWTASQLHYDLAVNMSEN